MHRGRPIKTGEYSKYTIPRLADKIEAARKDNRHLDIEDKIATTCALIENLGERITEDELIKYTPNLISLLDILTKQIERFHKIKYGIKHTITYERLDIVLNNIVVVINQEVKDASTRKRIASRLRELRIPESG